MKKLLKRLVAFVISAAMSSSVIPYNVLAENVGDNIDIQNVFEENNETDLLSVSENGIYTCDFTQLVKDGADTSYGTEADVYTLDKYTTAVLTYEGTRVTSDGKAYLYGSGANKGDGQYKNGSYIEFVAPADGTLNMKGDYYNYYGEGGKYIGYNTGEAEVKEGVSYYIGSRASNRTYISELTFTPTEKTEPTEPPVITPIPSENIELPYTWDFSSNQTASAGFNIPVISGSVLWSEENENIKFDANDKTAGRLRVDFKKALKGNIDLGFDLNVASFGGQTFAYTLTDSEDNELVYCSFEKFNGIAELRIGGETVALGEDITSNISSVTDDGMKADTTHFDNMIDFHAREAEVTIGEKTFTAPLQEEVTGEVSSFVTDVTRSKINGSRHIYMDNLSVAYFDSDKEEAPVGEVADGYLEGVYTSGEYSMPYRYRLPDGYEEDGKYPVVVYLHSSSRNGNDNINQMYNARYMFDEILKDEKNQCILIAPQCPEDGSWTEAEIENGDYVLSENATPELLAVEGIIDEFTANNRDLADTNKIYLAGFSDGAVGCWELALRNPEKYAAIIPVAGFASTSDEEKITALAESGIGVWAFNGYEDAKVTYNNARSIINKMQSAGNTNVHYTEYPYSGHGIAKEAALETGLYTWLFENSTNNEKEDKVVDLAIFMGQSNMCGRGEYEDAVECEPGHGYEFHAVTEPNVLSSVQEPFGKYENNSNVNDAGSNGKDRRSGDMVSALMESYYDASGVPIVGVQCSRGGTDTKYWTGAAVLGEAVSRYNAAYEYLEANGYTVRRKFMVWCQGEADADKSTGLDTYKSRTKSVFNHMEKNAGITEEFIVKTGHYNINYGLGDGETPSEEALSLDEKYKNINLAQSEIGAEDEDVTVVSSLYTDEYLALMKDQYHYHQQAYNEVGTMSGYNIAVAYDDSIGTPIPVPDPSAPDTTPSPTPSTTPSAPPTQTPSGDEYTDVKFDYNDDSKKAPLFESVGKNPTTCIYDVKDDISDKYLHVQAENAGTSKIAAAYMDLSEYTDNAKTVDLSFDMYVPYNSRSCIGFVDSSIRGDNYGESAGSTYSQTGNVISVIGGNASLKVNNENIAGDIKYTQTDGSNDFNWVHYDFSFDFSEKKMSYAAKSLDGSQTYSSKENVDFADSNCYEFSGIEVYSWLKGTQLKLDNLSIKAYAPANQITVKGETAIARIKDAARTQQYTISKTYQDDSEEFEWSVSGVDGVAIDKKTGVLSVSGTAKTGVATVKAVIKKSAVMPVGTEASIDVKIDDYAVVKSYDIAGSSTLGVGDSAKFSVENVIDTYGHDITKYVKTSGLTSSDSSVVEVKNETAKALKTGVANLTFKIDTGSENSANIVTVPVKSAVFEIKSKDESIDVSSIASYGNSTYRMYKPDGSYESVKAVNGKVENKTGQEVIVVPDYKFEFTNLSSTDNPHINGYVKVGKNSYTKESGYGLLDADYSLNENGCSPKSNPIKVDIPAGMYDVVVYRLGGTRADVYSNGTQIIQNTTSYGSQNRPSGSGVMDAPRVKIESGNANITFGNTSGNNERIASIEIVKVPEEYAKHVIWVAGDSESADYYPINSDGDDLFSQKIMMTGFGMQLEKFMSDDYRTANFGQPSATVKTWYDESFESVNNQMQKGDTLLIDFGINDAVSSSNKIDIETMKEYMRKMINAAKDKGVKPVLLSPVYCGKYQGKSYFTYKDGTNDMYAFADEMDVPYIDLNKYLQLYADGAAEDTGDRNWKANNYHVGDNLHLTQHGALLTASFIAARLSEMGYETTDFAYIYKDISETSTDKDGNIIRGNETGVSREYSVNAAREFMGLSPITDSCKVKMSYNDKTGVLTLTANSEEVSEGKLIKTVYNDDNTLKNVSIVNVKFSNGKATVNVASEKGMVLYLWDSMQSMKPLAEKYIYTEGGGIPSAAPSPSPSPTATVTTEPIEILYEENFENKEVGSNGGWTSPAGSMAVKKDAAARINNYLTVVSGKGGTCRTGYAEIPAISKNFVFEADFKSNAYDNVSSFEIVENKNSIYMNHGCYSNAKYAFKMNRPRSTDLYVINNAVSDSGLNLSGYKQPAVITKEIANDPWLHIKVVGDFEAGTVIAYVTSLDGKTEYYHGMTDMSEGIKSFKCLSMMSPSTGKDTCIDNIKIYTARESDLAPKYHKVKLTCKAYSFEQYVLDGESVVNIPDVSSYGENFEGWTVGSDTKKYTSEELKSVPITSDCEVVGNISENYIENLNSVEFNSFPAEGQLVMGADENTYGDNEISLSILGEQGTSLVLNPDSRVEDYTIEWFFDGFRTLDGNPTGETGNVYCDSYGLIDITEKAQSSVNFKLKRTSANYYGLVRAKVTYNGKTMEIQKPLVLLGDKSADSSVFLPKPGYTSDFNKYESTLDGYTATQNDIVTGGWSSSGSDSSFMEIKSDNSGRYLSLTRKLIGNSSYIHNTIGQISSQTVFEQDIRFGMDATISYMGGSVTSSESNAFDFAFSDGKFKLNGEDICSAEKNKWYHIAISADPTSKLCYAKIYNLSPDGNYSDKTPLGESELMVFNSNYKNGEYYRITLSKDRNSVDINNVKITGAGVREDTIEVTAPKEAKIPESGTYSVDLSVSAKNNFGDDSTGKAQWSIEDEFAEGVSIESAGNQSAKLIIDSTAVSGELPLRITIAGKSKTVLIKLLGNKDNVSFINAPVGIQIGNESKEYKYEAVVRNGNAENIDGREITYALYDENNKNAISPEGIKIDSKTGILTVLNNAEPQVITVRAVSTDNTGNEINKFVKVSVYALKFNFGADKIMDGYTPVNDSTVYNDNRGYGVEGTVSASGTGDKLTDTFISGANAVFKVKLEKGKVYNVTANYEGQLKCERINSSLTGVDKENDKMGAQTYQIAVFGDDIMDITIPSNGKLASVSIEPVEKSKANKPEWWTIGDSTVQQNGSWGYTISSNQTTDLSKYPELAAVAGGFHNSGKAGLQHKSYYAQGYLNSLLCGMNPGDVVSISGMGTNDSSSTFEEFKEYDEIYMNAIIDMGGYVVLGSYTPTGNYGATKGKVYDSDNMVFKGMRTNSYDRAIRELYEENKTNEKVLGFLDIGKISDDKMTADVKNAYNEAVKAGKSEADARAEANAKAQEMMAWWKDYNHYYITFSNYILPDITKEMAEIISSKLK